MRFRDFELERYFAHYEFSTEYLLSPSDCESITMQELIAMADQQGIELWNKLQLGYTESQGLPLLREEIATLYQEIDTDQLMEVVPAEGIFIALNAILNPGDHLIVTYPAYQSLYEIPRAMGCQLTHWKFQVRDGEWMLDLDFLRDAIQDNTRLLVINFPHNPTGYLPEKAMLQEVIELARANDLYVLSDEMYRLIEYQPENRLDSICDFYEQGITLSGLSKSFGLPGLRTGWLATRSAELLKNFMAVKDYTTICASAPSEILAVIALRAKDKLLKRNLGIIDNNLELARKFFQEYQDLFNWLPPKAGSIAFPELRIEFSIKEFCQRLVEEKNVMLLPGTVFDFSGNYFRLGLGRMDFQIGLGRLREFIEENCRNEG